MASRDYPRRDLYMYTRSYYHSLRINKRIEIAASKQKDVKGSFIPIPRHKMRGGMELRLFHNAENFKKVLDRNYQAQIVHYSKHDPYDNFKNALKK